MSYPNQKKIRINKAKADATHTYAIINIWAMQTAMKLLTKGSSFKLWSYLASNQNGYTFDLSVRTVQRIGASSQIPITAQWKIWLRKSIL